MLHTWVVVGCAARKASSWAMDGIAADVAVDVDAVTAQQFAKHCDKTQ